LKFPLTVNWKIHDVPTLEIPSFNPVTMITAPAHTLSLTLDILITECTLDKYNSRGMYITHFDVKMERGEIPAQKIPLPFPLQPGSLNIVAVGISYTITKKGNTQILLAEQWLPAGIVDACFMSEP
ncbi:MAG TPA: hypothetical protein VM012_07015, partial [Flavitalea sp.]|nr:hypothetical protein [Flavitalea sp.]